MIRYLSLSEILDLHQRIRMISGGAEGIRDLGALESAIAQPRATFGSRDLYPGVLTKAAALCYFLVLNHPFVDGNKRVGHAAMETMLILNGFEIAAGVEEQERTILDLAGGNCLGRISLIGLKGMCSTIPVHRGNYDSSKAAVSAIENVGFTNLGILENLSYSVKMR
jgi:death-on-curing protein